jgi:hypothetical protein
MEVSSTFVLRGPFAIAKYCYGFHRWAASTQIKDTDLS